LMLRERSTSRCLPATIRLAPERREKDPLVGSGCNRVQSTGQARPAGVKRGVGQEKIPEEEEEERRRAEKAARKAARAAARADRAAADEAEARAGPAPASRLLRALCELAWDCSGVCEVGMVGVEMGGCAGAPAGTSRARLCTLYSPFPRGAGSGTRGEDRVGALARKRGGLASGRGRRGQQRGRGRVGLPAARERRGARRGAGKRVLPAARRGRSPRLGRRGVARRRRGPPGVRTPPRPAMRLLPAHVRRVGLECRRGLAVVNRGSVQ